MIPLTSSYKQTQRAHNILTNQMSKVERTPIKTLESRLAPTKQSSMDAYTTPVINNRVLNIKRHASDHPSDSDSFSDLARLIQQNHQDSMAFAQAQTEQIKNQLADVDSKVDALRADVNTNFSAVNERIDRIEMDAARASNDIISLQQKLEKLEQGKLDCQMVINGIEPATVDARKDDLAHFTLELLTSFGCPSDPNNINEVFVIKAFNDKRRIVVAFKTVAAKLEVMKKKRESQDTRKIYFDHRMTPAINKLYHQARHFAKDKGGRAFLYGGSVYYEKAPKAKRRIDSAEDLTEDAESSPQ